MEQLRYCVDRCVEVGIRAYIGLLCCGEVERSRRVFHDAMQLSSLARGGPSAPVTGGTGPLGSLSRCLAYFTVRSLLASLLVLRTTVYWQRVPELRELQEVCGRLGEELGDLWEQDQPRLDDEGGAFAACAEGSGGSPPDNRGARAVRAPESLQPAGRS